MEFPTRPSWPSTPLDDRRVTLSAAGYRWRLAVPVEESPAAWRHAFDRFWNSSGRRREAEELFRSIFEGLTPLKSSQVRRLGRGSLPGTDFGLVVKEYLPRGLGPALRALVSRTPAQREWRALRRLRRAGVAVPRPLALGQPQSRLAALCGRGALVMEALPNTITLEELLLHRFQGSTSPPPLPSGAAARLGRLVRSLHDAGVAHPDLHAANVLLDPAGEFHLIDFHSAGTHSGSVGWPKRRRDLIAFSGAFLSLGQPADRWRFFKAYRWRDLDGRELLREARRIEGDAWKRLFSFLRRFDGRPLRRGRGFQRISVHNWHGMAERSQRALALVRCLGPFPEEVLRREGRVIKDQSAGSVFALSVDRAEYIVKLYRQPGLQGMAKRLFRGSRARAAWINGYRLRSRLLPAPTPVIVLEEALPAPEGRSLVAFEKVSGLPTLDRYVAATTETQRRVIVRELAVALARMHRFFLAHRDLKAPNILVSSDGKPVFIDPDGISLVAHIDRYIMARDLMRLNASFAPRGSVRLTERLRFLALYARCRGLDREQRLALRFDVLQLTLAKWGR